MAGLIKLKEETHNISLKIRNIERLISSTQFEQLWDETEDKEPLIKLVKDLKRKEITALLKDIKEPGEMGYDALRERAKNMQIPGYSRMSKMDLIRAVRKEIKRGEIKKRNDFKDQSDVDGD